jgi:threonine/homoserine/homoserine lactone efflux protein
MTDLNFWMLFFGAAVALNIAPGPDLIFILTKTISGGRLNGIAASAGVCTGALFHVAIAALGLSAILYTSAIAFTIVKYIGALFLLYLAFQAFRSSGTSLDINAQGNAHTSIWKSFKQGVLIDVLNPKVAIFFMAFLPQFVRENHGSTASQLLYLGLLVIMVAILVELIYVLLASHITSKVRQSKRLSLWLKRLVGIIYISLGVKLAASNQFSN